MLRRGLSIGKKRVECEDYVNSFKPLGYGSMGKLFRLCDEDDLRYDVKGICCEDYDSSYSVGSKVVRR